MEGLIAGMSKRYKGLMDEQSRSLAGLISTTQDLAFGQRGLFGRFGEYAADTIRLRDVLTGLNTGLERVLDTIEEKGFGEALKTFLPPGSEAGLVALGGALAGITGKGVYEGLRRLIPLVISFGKHIGPWAIVGAEVALALYGIHKMMQLIQGDLEQLLRQQTGNTEEDTWRSFGGEKWTTGEAVEPESPMQQAAKRLQEQTEAATGRMSELRRADEELMTALTGKQAELPAEPPKVLTSEGRIAELLADLEALHNAVLTGSGAVLERIKSSTEAFYDWHEYLSAAPGFAAGGRVTPGGSTANVSPTASAGIIEVHGQEWIMPAWMAKRHPELVAWLEDYRKTGIPDTLPSFAEGGPVSPAPMQVGGYPMGDIPSEPVSLPVVEVDAYTEAGRALKRLADEIKAAKRESERGADIFFVERAKEAEGQYALARRNIVESLMRTRDSGTDAMYNLGIAVANNSRRARDSVVNDFGNIKAAADDLAGQGYEFTLDTTEAQNNLNALKNDLAGLSPVIRLTEEEMAAASVDIEQTIKQLRENVASDMKAIADAMKLSRESAADDTAKMKNALGTMADDTENRLTAWNLFLIGVTARAVPSMIDDLDDLGAHANKVFARMAENAILRSSKAEDALRKLGRTFGDLRNEADNWHFTIQDAARGGLQALELLSNTGVDYMGLVKKEFVSFLDELHRGEATWESFGGTMMDIARQAIVAAEAQLLAAKTAALGAALMKIFVNPAQALAEAAAVTVQAAAGLAALEALRAMIPAAAEGGIVTPRPGGTLVNVAEAGKTEAIVPLDRLEQFINPPAVKPIEGQRPASGSQITLQIVLQNPVIREEQDIDDLAEAIMESVVRRLKQEGAVLSG